MHIASSTLQLQPGIYILRYPQGGKGALSVTRAPDTAPVRGTLSTPDTHGSILRTCADCIVSSASATSWRPKSRCQFTLEGTAWFSGGFSIPLRSGMPASGPSGLEHLTALRLRALPAAQPGASPWDASARTTAFRAEDASKPAARPKQKSASRTAK